MTLYDRTVSRIMLGLMTLISAGFVFTLFQMIRPYHVVDFINLEVPAIIYREQTTTYINHFCKYMAIPAEVIVTVEDGSSYQLFGQVNNVAPGCVNNVRAFEIPGYLPAGKYRLHFTAIYHPNQFRTITKEVYSNEFELR